MVPRVGQAVDEEETAPALLPGPRQTEEYAHAVFQEAVPKLNGATLLHRLSHRLRRRDVLDRADPLKCTFLIHEAALRMAFGSRKIAQAQLGCLLKHPERDNVTVHQRQPLPGGRRDIFVSKVWWGGPCR
ncbi:Scr1 family TA system antitoxin-like transcriptional regulator [Streptomyces alkaliterrae]|uniref:DUF5753 domain-containing protein n=1 Tax=Streptomyces alkaliterrae TaxID=2213162 RepID=A0A5P0YUA8_9ACTN|nr:Scr1 family TA system antitoxin-like transcriptional regulator [Streptomyces alkaliterrae]MBB1261549.1 hypothetical protein [Streptomyces alkaliterrae]MQS03896.1 hypothetical protein [Streptomyces alkaliterrae]